MKSYQKIFLCNLKTPVVLCFLLTGLGIIEPKKAKAFTALVKVVSASSQEITVTVGKERNYKIDVDYMGCSSYDTGRMKPNSYILFYRNTDTYVGGNDPMNFSYNSDFSDPPAVFLINTESGIGSSNGRCRIRSSHPIIRDSQGCCSYHGGISGCFYGKVQCVDGTTSKNCTC